MAEDVWASASPPLLPRVPIPPWGPPPSRPPLNLIIYRPRPLKPPHLGPGLHMDGPRWWRNSVHCTSVELEILLWHSSTHSFIWKFSGNLSLFTSSFFKKISFSYAAVRMATAHFASLDHNNESFHERSDGGILLFINPLNRDWENFLMKRASHLSVGAF